MVPEYFLDCLRTYAEEVSREAQTLHGIVYSRAFAVRLDQIATDLNEFAEQVRRNLPARLPKRIDVASS